MKNNNLLYNTIKRSGKQHAPHIKACIREIFSPLLFQSLGSIFS